MSFYRPSDYRHRRHFETAADRNREFIPYLGGPEDRVKSAFVDSYRATRDIMRSSTFAEHLDHAMRISKGQAKALVDGYLADAETSFEAAVVREFQPIVSVGAASVLIMPTTKARPRRRVYPRLNLTRTTRHPRLYTAPSSHIAAAKSLTLDLITHVTESQRSKAHKIVTDAFTRGYTADQTGERLANVVGLFPRWQSAVDNFYTTMLKKEVPHRIAQSRASDYADTLLDKRGEMIARTEIVRALNDGRLAGWHDLADKGYFDAAESTKVWSATDQDNTCEYCWDLNGQKVKGVDGLFDTIYGPVSAPPLHPHCRCTVLMEMAPVEVSDDDRAQAESALSDRELSSLLDNLPV